MEKVNKQPGGGSRGQTGGAGVRRVEGGRGSRGSPFSGGGGLEFVCTGSTAVTMKETILRFAPGLVFSVFLLYHSVERKKRERGQCSNASFF